MAKKRKAPATISDMASAMSDQAMLAQVSTIAVAAMTAKPPENHARHRNDPRATNPMEAAMHPQLIQVALQSAGNKWALACPRPSAAVMSNITRFSRISAGMIASA